MSRMTTVILLRFPVLPSKSKNGGVACNEILEGQAAAYTVGPRHPVRELFMSGVPFGVADSCRNICKSLPRIPKLRDLSWDCELRSVYESSTPCKPEPRA